MIKIVTSLLLLFLASLCKSQCTPSTLYSQVVYSDAFWWLNYHWDFSVQSQNPGITTLSRWETFSQVAGWTVNYQAESGRGILSGRLFLFNLGWDEVTVESISIDISENDFTYLYCSNSGPRVPPFTVAANAVKVCYFTTLVPLEALGAVTANVTVEVQDYCPLETQITPIQWNITNECATLYDNTAVYSHYVCIPRGSISGQLSGMISYNDEVPCGFTLIFRSYGLDVPNLPYDLRAYVPFFARKICLATPSDCTWSADFYENNFGYWPSGFSPYDSWLGTTTTWGDLIQCNNCQYDCYRNCAREYIAATLNSAYGAQFPDQVVQAFQSAGVYLASNTPEESVYYGCPVYMETIILKKFNDGEFRDPGVICPTVPPVDSF